MIKIRLPGDPDEYQGVPLSLGGENPVAPRDRAPDKDVAYMLAQAVAYERAAVRASILEYLEHYARSTLSKVRARAAEMAIGLIREAEPRRSTA